MKIKKQTLTGGEADALTTKEEAFLEKPNEDWTGLVPSICLATSIEDVKDEDDTNACVAIFFFCS